MANSITISGSPVSTAAPAPDDLCLISGYIKDIQGNPLKSTEITIRHLHTPLGVSSTTLILQEHQTAKTDVNGYVAFNLWRTASVQMEMPGRPDLVLDGTVPDQAAADLLDLFLPYVTSVAFDEASFAVDVDELYEVLLTGTLSDGSTLDVTAACTLTSSDDAITASSTGNFYVGVDAGSATISCDSFDADILELNQEPGGDVIVRLSVPSATLPSDLPVTVTS
jgi:hypothetical protein